MKKYISIGALAFLVAIFIYIPASVASKLLPKNITASQFQGNLWNGSALSLIANQVSLGSVSWKIKPSCFLILKLCADIKQSNTELTSSFSLEMRGTTKLQNLIAQGDAQVLSAFVNDYGITLTGNFEADLAEISFDEKSIHHIEGNMQFSSLAVNGVLRLAVGNVDAVFEPKNNHTDIDISNNDGHVDFSGNVQLFSDMNYELNLDIRKNSKSTEAIINGMQFVGETQQDGSVRVKQSGKLVI